MSKSKYFSPYLFLAIAFGALLQIIGSIFKITLLMQIAIIFMLFIGFPWLLLAAFKHWESSGKPPGNPLSPLSDAKSER
jgi:magnesium-transporting ATPase (P-type)